MVVSNQHENKKGDQFQGFGVECQPFIKSEEDIMGRRRVPRLALGRYTYRVSNVDPTNLTQGGLH